MQETQVQSLDKEDLNCYCFSFLLQMIFTSREYPWVWLWATSHVAQLVKKPPAMQETWVWSLGWEDSLEKGTATHSSILDWRIPRTEEPGRLQSIESTKSQTRLSNFDFTQYVQELERNSPGVWKFMAWENKEPAETGRAWACLAHGHLSVNCLLKWPEQYVVSV